MTPSHHVEVAKHSIALLLKLPDFSLFLPERYTNLSKIFYLTHPDLQSGGSSYQRCNSISVVLLSYKQAITSFPSYSPHQKRVPQSSSGRPICKHLRFFREEIHCRNFYFTFSFQIKFFQKLNKFFPIYPPSPYGYFQLFMLFYAYSVGFILFI